MLSVHGRREDGFHRLTSLVVALDFGDTLGVELGSGRDRLHCSDASVPCAVMRIWFCARRRPFERPLVWNSILYSTSKAHSCRGGSCGGSGNAATALKAMNQLCDKPLSGDALSKLSAGLGSDCPFFVDGRPAVMSGRGECIDPLPEALCRELTGRRLVLFKPDFAVQTEWAYGQLIRSAPDAYEAESCAKERLLALGAGRSALEGAGLLVNSFEPVIGRKYMIPALLNALRAEGVPCLMSGSGSCCFALQVDGGPDFVKIEQIVRAAWGESVFFVETQSLVETVAFLCWFKVMQCPLSTLISSVVSEDSTKTEIVLEGIAASPGIAHGTAFVYLQKQLDVPCYDIAGDCDAEIERFDQAILETRAEITAVQEKIADSLGEGEARIFDAHLLVLEDNALIEEVVAELKTSGKNIECCYNKVAQHYISFFSRWRMITS